MTKRRGKIAQLPYEIRKSVNQMIRDGRPYFVIIRTLADQKHPGITESNLSNWVQGEGGSSGYRDWLREQQRLDGMKAKREFALEVVKANEGSKIHEASLQLAASQIYDVISDFDPRRLKELLDEKPGEYTDLVGALAKLSKGALDLDKFKASVSKAHAEVQKLRDSSKALDETERNAILDEVDRILGLKK